jgi:hypothetical protein
LALVLSWYVRPLLLLPFCWAAHRRSPAGMALSLLALATSMAWFPAPERPSAGVVAMLEAERAYLAGPWTAWKVALALLAPAALAALGAAFWRRSPGWGPAVVAAMMLGKVAWSHAVAPAEGAAALVPPALVGLAACAGAILWAARASRRRPGR